MYPIGSGVSHHWVRECASFIGNVAPNSYNWFHLVRPSDVLGVRKIKNFRVGLRVTPETLTNPSCVTWILAVQRQMDGAQQYVVPLYLTAPNNISDVINVPDALICCGVCGNFSLGGETYCPLARLIGSGDYVALYLVSTGHASDQVNVALTVSYAICYA
jgi:hypothetical protein